MYIKIDINTGYGLSSVVYDSLCKKIKSILNCNFTSGEALLKEGANIAYGFESSVLRAIPNILADIQDGRVEINLGNKLACRNDINSVKQLIFDEAHTEKTTSASFTVSKEELFNIQMDRFMSHINDISKKLDKVADNVELIVASSEHDAVF